MQCLKFLIYFILHDFVEANLYSEYNRKQDKVSDYAQKKLRELSSPSLDSMLESNSKTIKQNLNYNIIPRGTENENREYLIDSHFKKVFNSVVPNHHHEPYQENNLNYNNMKLKNGHKKENVKKRKVIDDNFEWMKQNPIKLARFLKEINKDNHDISCHKRQNRIPSCCSNVYKSKHKTKRQTKRDSETPTLPLINPNTIMNSNPSLYPGVITNTPDLTRYTEIVHNNQMGITPYTNPLINQIKQNPEMVQNPFSPYGNMLSIYDQNNPNINLVLRDNNKVTNNTIKKLAEEENKLVKLQMNNSTPIGECPEIIDPNNATAVLERVLQELELIRQAKEGNEIPEGMACDVMGSWNSEIIGMRFDINMTNSSQHDLDVKILEHNPPKRIALMDTNWSCSGFTLHSKGGPFYIVASMKKEEVLATFTGICKICGGIETIFGTWSIVHPAKDCRDLQMSIDTKRDIFRKETLHLKRLEKLEKIKNEKKNKE